MTGSKTLHDPNRLVIATRLRPPVVAENLVVRPRLLEGLVQPNSGGRLNLLNAPAGYGKSMLMSQCYDAYTNSGWSAAWLTLEDVDNDTEHFGLYFSEMLKSLQITLPNIKLDNKRRAAETVAAFLSSVEKQRAPCALFFDDMHSLSNESLLEFFRQLVVHLPESVSVFIGSRTSLPIPLSKFRTSGRLLEIGIDDLRFNEQEASQLYLNSNNIDIDSGLLESLLDQTGGWVVVMQLAAVSLKNIKDKAAFVEQFSSADKPVSEFLNEEFLDIIGPSASNFLRQISIVDRVCPGLCVAITGDDNHSTQLDSLTTLGCLVQNLGAGGKWLRVHPIVRDYLSGQLELLNPIEKEELHRRAARWFESEGLIGEAIQHALSGSDEEYALDLLEQGGTHLINTGYLSHLLRLVRRLPDAVVENSLEVLEQLAWLEVFNANVPQAERLLSQMKQVLRKKGTNELSQWTKAIEIEAAIYLYDENYEQGRTLIEEWLPKIPDDLVRVIASLKQVDSYIKISEFNFDPARENARWVLNQANNHHIEITKSFAACVLSLVYYHRGLIKQGQISLEAFLKQLRLRVGDSSQAIAVVESMLAANLYQRGEIDSASLVLERNAKTHKQLVPAEHLLVLVPVRVRLFVQSGNYQEALDYLSELQIVAEEKQWIRLEASILNEMVRIFVALGDVSQASAAYDATMMKREAVPDKHSAQFVQTNSCCEIARARIHSAMDNARSASAIIEEQLESSRRQGRHLRSLELLVLLAKIHALEGESHRAVGCLIEALKSDRENSCVQVFRDEGSTVTDLLSKYRGEIIERSGEGFRVIWNDQISRILQESLTPAVDQVNSTMGPLNSDYLQMVETLTKRELEVLKLLAIGLSNKEISSELKVSPNTVKTHLQACYGKLGVTRRTQATVRLRELGLFG